MRASHNIGMKYLELTRIWDTRKPYVTLHGLRVEERAAIMEIDRRIVMWMYIDTGAWVGRI